MGKESGDSTRREHAQESLRLGVGVLAAHAQTEAEQRRSLEALTEKARKSPGTVTEADGTTPAGDVRVTGSTDFGEVCAGVLAEKTISVCNVGQMQSVGEERELGGALSEFRADQQSIPGNIASRREPERFDPL